MMRPKSWSVLTDALNEGAHEAALAAVEILSSNKAFESDPQKQVENVIREKMLHAIRERFHFEDEPTR